MVTIVVKTISRIPMPVGRVTIRDVAQAARVSTATVSRVLNRPDRVDVRLRARVEAAVARLGYVVDGAGRALASRRSKTVGAIVPTLDNAIFAAGINALQLRLDDHGYVLLVASSEYDDVRERRELQALVERGVDAVMLIGTAHVDSVRAILAAAEIPAVVAWAIDRNSPWPCVGFDNARAMARIVEHLVDLGHRRIAMIAGITRGNDRAAERLRGAREALTRRGLELVHLFESPYSFGDGRAAMRSLMGLATRPTAVVCGNDVLAMAALFEAQRLGIGVPGDVSITGFDDLELASHLSPALTTAHVPAAEMGRRVADYLAAALAGQDMPRMTELEVRVVLRETTAPPTIAIPT
jgi:LacI family transcriptional regulator